MRSRADSYPKPSQAVLKVSKRERQQNFDRQAEDRQGTRQLIMSGDVALRFRFVVFPALPMPCIGYGSAVVCSIALFRTSSDTLFASRY